MKKLLLIIGLTLMVVGCSHPPKESVNISWPPAPQPPRVKYVKSIYGSENLSRSFLGKIRDFFIGKKKPTSIGKPYGLTFHADSKLYMADTSKKGVLIFDLKSGKTKFINSLGKFGYLLEPVYVILDNKGNVYVSDTELKKVVVFDKNYKFSHFIGDEATLEAPVGLAFNSDESQLFVVDTRGHRVVVYNKDGTYLKTIGKRGDEKGEFHYPMTVQMNKNDTVYVVDAFHFAVQAFDIDGNFLFSFGPKKVGMGAMARPRDIGIDSDGNIYITDAMRNNIQIYSSKGELLLRFGEVGNAPGQFQLPAGISIDKNDFIYIADSVNKRIQVFKYVASTEQ